MPLFSYKAIDSLGNKVKGKINKDSPELVRDFLKQQDLMPYDINKLNFLTKDISDFKLFSPKLKAKDISHLVRELAFLLNAGISINKCLIILQNRCKNNILNSLLHKTYEDILKGESLSEAMGKHSHFPGFLIHMLKIGEITGTLPEVLNKTAIYYEKESALRSRIKSASIYPCLVLVLMLVIMVAALIFIIPSYAQVFLANDAELPFATVLLMKLSDFFILYWNIIIFFIIASVIGGSYFFKSQKISQALDKFYLTAFPISLFYRKILNFRFVECLSILLNSGVHILEALEIVKNTIHNSIFNQLLDDVISQMRQGGNLSFLFQKIKYLDSIVIEMIEVGEQTGLISETMGQCAYYLNNELDDAVDIMGKLVEPIITIVLGVILGFIMLAIILPTFTLGNIL